MVGVIYFLCALTALACSWLLFRAFRRSSYRLLLWGSMCFAGLTANNLLVIFDKLAVPYVDLTTIRLLIALLSSLVFLYGLIWDTE